MCSNANLSRTEEYGCLVWLKMSLLSRSLFGLFPMATFSMSSYHENITAMTVC